MQSIHPWQHESSRVKTIAPHRLPISLMAIFDQADNPCIIWLISASALVKVAVFFLAWSALWLPLAIAIATRLKWHPPKPLAAQQKLPFLAVLYLIAPLIIWGATQIEDTSFPDYGWDWTTRILISLVGGLGVAILSLGISFTGQWLVGWVDWHGENWQQLTRIGLPICGIGLGIGLIEELVFRGFLVTELQQDYSLAIAAVISSLIFALLHLIWEQQQTLPQIPGLWLMGMVLVLARCVNGGSLGLAWGLHAGWIWGLTCLQEAKLISYTRKGPIWITGIGDNPLAGISGILCLLGVAAFLWGISH